MAQKSEHAVPQPLVAPPLPLKDFEVMFNDEENGGYLPEKVGHPPPKAMKRKLKERQLTMMSIGGTIGTGLFLGMGSSLNDGGPMGLLLGYLIMWVHQQNITLYFFGECGEYSFAICVAGEVTAAAIVVDYWKAPVSQGVWITLVSFALILQRFSKVFYASTLQVKKPLIIVFPISFSSQHVPSTFLESSATESLLLFYVASAFVIGLVVPFNDPQLLGGTGDASSSPFVIAINRSKIKILPDLINAVVLVSAYSATSSEVYCGSRVLHGLVIDRMAPQIFGKVNSSGNPINALIASALPGLLAFMNLSEKSGTVFLWLVNISAMGGIFTWWSVCLTYIRFHKGLKARGVDRDRLDYKAPFQPYLSYYGVVMLAAIILMSGFKVFLNGQWQAPVQPIHSNLQSARRSSHFFSRSWGSFIGAYITLPIFGLTYLFW
ncbi:hypothetical protein PGTUg99_021517 [Puccinia graminis f. sp. tritici]|uniref:Amino acid permease/ SLC12A domain-containing protein n=1 Tax=Puccinia graminis f. sp. tritici TaxID=56615 RepID=A0A5B0S5S5_PUCGR|nr:hypothetical protein PGTUg99_021517 [Puccinia graminis f. sp. tritici]